MLRPRLKLRTAVVLSCVLAIGCYEATRQAPPSDGDGRSGSSGAARSDGGRDEPAPGRDAAPWREPDAARGDVGVPRDDASMTSVLDSETSGPIRPTTESNLRLAFVGDQSLGVYAISVLELIRDEGADLVIHGGDFDYVGEPAAWEQQIDDVLGADFPYFAAVGNHDLPQWSVSGGYQERLVARLSRVADARCDGDYGNASVCTFRGLRFVLSGVGTTTKSDHEAYLEQALQDDAIWRLCVWHKNQHDMQVGGKTDEVGWLAYQVCQEAGAPILTAHEHAYARTYTLNGLGVPEISHGSIGAPDELFFDTGMTAVFLSGLGGHSTRSVNSAPGAWWATIYTGSLQRENGMDVSFSPSVEFGVLFIDFNVDGDPYKARGYFKTITGEIIDRFTMHVPR